VLQLIRDRDHQDERGDHIVRCLLPELLRHEEEGIYFLTDSGEVVPQTSRMCGLVLESGGRTLREHLKDSQYSLEMIQSVHILEDIVRAVSFLHRMQVVHFDLKPDNIVSFAHGHQQTRWKLIDFDASYDEISNPRPVITSLNVECRLTEEFISPEVMRVFGDRTSSVSLEISSKVDIWSLGMVAVLLFAGRSLWSLLYRNRSFNASMLLNLTQSDIQTILAGVVGMKEKAFVEACLQVNPSQRSSAADLLKRSLFTTLTSTVQAQSLRNVTASLEQKMDNLHSLMNQYKEQSQSLICDEVEGQMSELERVLVDQLQRIGSLQVDEIRSILEK